MAARREGRTLDKQEILAERAKRLARLEDSPDWQELKAERGRKEERLNARLGAIYRDRADTTLEWERHYVNGFLDGIDWLLSIPAQAERRLEAALKKADELKEANLVG